VSRERDSETGQYTQAITDGQILNLLADQRLGTSEVAEQLECHRTTAHSRLKALEEEGKVKSREVGRSFVWEPDGGGETSN
jgi:DNA-binding IclR family transcriptional regulator